jgi:hypothetical protein
MRDYLRASHFSHLPEDAIALYDDETAEGSERIFYFGEKLLHDGLAGREYPAHRPLHRAVAGSV